jgi:hypothetical protein
MTTVAGDRSSTRWVVTGVVAAALLVAGCGGSTSEGTDSTSTGVTRTAVASTGVASTRPTSTGPTSAGVTSAGSTSMRVRSTGPRSTGPTSPTLATSCPAHATGTVGGRERQAIWFRPPGVTHQRPDRSAALVACTSSGLPVTFSLAIDPAPLNYQLDAAGPQPRVSVWTVQASCVVVASPAGDGRLTPAAPVLHVGAGGAETVQLVNSPEVQSTVGS